jgi:hypothetical protein
MPRLSPVNAIVMSADVGKGKAIIELKAPRSTLTLELAEDSGWVPLLREGAIVTYTFDVEEARPTEDQITSTATLESSGKPRPQPELVEEDKPLAVLSDDARAALGLPERPPDPNAPTTGTAVRSSNPS